MSAHRECVARGVLGSEGAKTAFERVVMVFERCRSCRNRESDQCVSKHGLCAVSLKRKHSHSVLGNVKHMWPKINYAELLEA